MKFYKEQPEGDYYRLGLYRTVGIEKYFKWWFSLCIPIWPSSICGNIKILVFSTYWLIGKRSCNFCLPVIRECCAHVSRLK